MRSICLCKGSQQFWKDERYEGMKLSIFFRMLSSLSMRLLPSMRMFQRAELLHTTWGMTVNEKQPMFVTIVKSLLASMSTLTWWNPLVASIMQKTFTSVGICRSSWSGLYVCQSSFWITALRPMKSPTRRMSTVHTLTLDDNKGFGIQSVGVLHGIKMTASIILLISCS